MPKDLESRATFSLYIYKLHELINTMLNTTGTIETIAQACSIYAAGNFRLPVRGFGRAVTALICAPLQIAGLIAQWLMPDECNLYLDHAVLAYKTDAMSDHDENR